jgi:hypothetical protein
VFNDDSIKLIGFNKLASDPRTCYQKVRFSNMNTDKTYTLHIVSTQMSDMDFPKPEEEVKRILLNLYPNMRRTRELHVKAWMDMWKHNITIEARPDASDEDKASVASLVKATRLCLYSIWSCIRDGSITDTSPLMDARGNIFWDGDLWFLPFLILFRPTIARAVLETRHSMLGHAMKLASGYGFAGSKFPSTTETTGYGDNPYWDTSASLHIFNTALVSINVWNYYRTTLDKHWLTNKGYEILKHNADFFASKVEVEPDGSMHMRNVCSMNNVECDDNALTCYLAKIALQYAIEASYELQMVVNEDWVSCFHGLDLVYDPSSLVVSTEGCCTGGIAENLVPLLPMYSEVLAKSHRGLDIKKMVAQNMPMDFNTHGNVLNLLIKAWLAGATSATSLDTELANIVNTCFSSPWSIFDSRDGSTDVSLCAMFLLVIATTTGTLRFGGNVTETRFYTEKLGLSSSHACYMPRAWKCVKMGGVGKTRATVLVWNETM